MSDQNFTIEKLENYSPQAADSIRKLAKQIGNNYHELTDDDVKDMIASPNTTIFLAKTDQQKIVGMVTIMIYRIPYVKKAYFEDLVVDEENRGQGIGTALMQKTIELVKQQGAAYLDFTSRPRRLEGNKFYQKLGFEQRETNVYRLLLDYKEV